MSLIQISSESVTGIEAYATRSGAIHIHLLGVVDVDIFLEPEQASELIKSVKAALRKNQEGL